jgi:hypothetical protein
MGRWWFILRGVGMERLLRYEKKMKTYLER